MLFSLDSLSAAFVPSSSNTIHVHAAVGDNALDGGDNGGGEFGTGDQSTPASDDDPSDPNLQGGKNYGITDASNAGQQWSRLAGVDNGLFGKEGQNSYTISYANLSLYDPDSTEEGVKGGDTTDETMQKAERRRYRNESEAAEYGMALGEMGFDHSTSIGFTKDAINHAGRLIGGALLWIGQGVNFLDYWGFSNIMTLFNFLNPLSYISNSGGQSGGALSGLEQTFQGWINGNSAGPGAADIGRFVAAFACFIGIAFVLLGKGKRHTFGSSFMHVLWKFLLRMFAILIWPIFLVTALGFIMQSTQQAFKTDGDSASNYAIYGSLVDFQNWVRHSRLEIPEELQNGSDGYIPYGEDDSVPPATQQAVLDINAEGAGLSDANSAVHSMNDSSNGNGSLPDADRDDQAEDGGASEGSTNGDTSEGTLHAATNNLIHRWMNDSYYTPSEWSSYVRANMPPSQADDSTSKIKDDLLSKKVPPDMGNKDSSNEREGPGVYPYIQNGTLYAMSGDSGNAGANHEASYYKSMQPNPTDNGTTALESDVWGGISTLGMYNYLSTIFYPSSMEWVNSTKYANKLGEPAHKSVGLAGRGVNAVGGFLMMMALMAVIGFLGLWMIMYDARVILKSVPYFTAYTIGNALGSLKLAVRLGQATLMLVVVLVGTALIWVMGRQVLLQLLSVPGKFFSNNPADNDNALYSGNSDVITGFLGRHFDIAQASAATSTIYGFIECGIAILLVCSLIWMGHLKKPIFAAVGQWLRTQISNLFSVNNRNNNGGGGNNNGGSSIMNNGGSHSLFNPGGIFSNNNNGGNSANNNNPTGNHGHGKNSHDDDSNKPNDSNGSNGSHNNEIDPNEKNRNSELADASSSAADRGQGSSSPVIDGGDSSGSDGDLQGSEFPDAGGDDSSSGITSDTDSPGLDSSGGTGNNVSSAPAPSAFGDDPDNLNGFNAGTDGYEDMEAPADPTDENAGTNPLTGDSVNDVSSPVSDPNAVASPHGAHSVNNMHHGGSNVRYNGAQRLQNKRAGNTLHHSVQAGRRATSRITSANHQTGFHVDGSHIANGSHNGYGRNINAHNVSSPMSSTQANNNVRSALGETQEVGRAIDHAKAMYPNRPMPSAEYHSLAGRAHNAQQNLHQARMQAAGSFNSQPVYSGFLGKEPSPGSSVLTNGQTYHALNNIYQAQSNLQSDYSASGLTHSVAQIKRDNSQLNKAISSAEELGLNPAIYRKPSNTLHVLRGLNKDLSMAMRGNTPGIS